MRLPEGGRRRDTSQTRVDDGLCLPAEAPEEGGGAVSEFRLVVVPTTISDARVYVRQHHRHHLPSLSGLFAVACAFEGQDIIRGVAMVGRPVSRMEDNGFTVEVNRLATDGTMNACSLLYRAAWRVAVAMGYRRLITYTLPEEGGASLKASGFRLLGEAGGGSWSGPSRPRVDRAPMQKKLKWEVTNAR